MPDEQTMNATLKAYGLSNMMGPGGFNWWVIFGGIIFSIVGWYAFQHGRKEKSWRPMAIGIVLMVYPYFIGDTLLFFAVGLGLCAALYFWRG